MDRHDGRFIQVPTHHQRIGSERTSLPNVSSFIQYPRKVERYICRDLQREDEFAAQYVILYTYDRNLYGNNDAVWRYLRENWYGEIVVFRKGRFGSNVVHMSSRRGDTERVVWKAIER